MDETATGDPTVESLQGQLAEREAELAASHEAGRAAIERLKSRRARLPGATWRRAPPSKRSARASRARRHGVRRTV